MYKAVGLLKDIGYHKFAAQLARQAYAYSWNPEIMDFSLYTGSHDCSNCY
jgi:hypothetical protein